jgi:hypothetical protein
VQDLVCIPYIVELLARLVNANAVAYGVAYYYVGVAAALAAIVVVVALSTVMRAQSCQQARL